MGLAFGLLTRLLLRFMAYLNASKDQEVALTLAMAYLAYWVTGSPCKGSGEEVGIIRVPLETSV